MAPSSKKNVVVPAPSWIEPISFPVFAMSWYVVNPSDGYTRVAYAGGGGSARTGVSNRIVVRDNFDPPILLSTDTSVGIALKLYHNPLSNNQYMIVAMENTIRRYKFPLPLVPEGSDSIYSDAPYDVLTVHNHTQQPTANEQPTRMTINAIAINCMASMIAVGNEDSSVYVYGVADDIDLSTIIKPILYFYGHTGPISAVSFSMRNDRLVSAGKDGFARVWDCRTESDDNIPDDRCMAVLPCSIDDEYSKASVHPSDPSLVKNDTDMTPTKRRPPQVLVRGCAFADIDGNVILTVASGRRGKAFVYRWICTNSTNPNDGLYNCSDRNECSPVPVSSMSLSDDGMLLSLGSVEGSITLWDVMEWKSIRRWDNVHELPVMGVCSRPYAIPVLMDEVPILDDDGTDMNPGSGVPVHARSASADGRMSCLTLLRTVPKRKKPKKQDTINDNSLSNIAGNILYFIHRIILLSILTRIFFPVIYDARKKCFTKPKFQLEHLSKANFDSIRQCLVDDFLIAPSDRPGISSPLY
jgi:WD domain, G-beta repeat